MKASDCILIIPASGFSRRFGEADKLCAILNGRPLADYAAETASLFGFQRMIAVVPSENTLRADIFRARGFDIVENNNPALGQMHSIHLGARSIMSEPKAICIMLADMPLVNREHLTKLLTAAPSDGAAKTQYKGYLQPPAIFSGRACDGWRFPEIDNDGFARHIAKGPAVSVPLEMPFGDDVDTIHDLETIAANMVDLAL